MTQYGHSKNHSADRKTHCVPRLGPTLKTSGPLTEPSELRLTPWLDNRIVGTGSANNGADTTIVATGGTDSGSEPKEVGPDPERVSHPDPSYI